MKEENVILVNEDDQPIGLMPKMEAHEKAVLHRAFSVFIVNEAGEIMLQQRAADKYHSPLLWTNTCCSHQREGETNIEAGKRRLQEEMGFSVDLKELFSFIYKAPFDNGLTEHELDHVMIGYYNDVPNINPKEVASWKWMQPSDIKKDISENPEEYTAWFKIIFERFYDYLVEHSEKSSW
ncbi:isopentenyl-diphosphate Delta-isomerase [Flagellimonas meridianipacifica]|uniref:Isopentenyl-diphosphate delta-isomerase n=1 Tax=Flagellimonas meridianipacifica TaxID=1080225 RepID=A0A2T0M6N5_9FLAO|nr:isopentenyl-diphosphate Delta-isomerase [Allomuricauda pacifica]PRX53159.1 isopentenyl-diphosphate delta-isomerase [Allomuricauda pacifica]